MAKHGRTGEQAREPGMYICGDGCERRFYREGDAFLTCQMDDGDTHWVKVEEQ